MADGDIGIWTDTNGTFSWNQTSWTGFPFNNPVGTPAAIYTQQVNDIDIQVSEAGKYLVIYNVAGNDASHGNSRVQYNARITVGATQGSGTEVPGSLNDGYSRNDTNHSAYLNGFAIVDASANDYIRVDLIRTGSNTSSLTTIANWASLMIIKLDGDWDYFRCDKNGIVQGFQSESWGDVTWHEIEKDGSYTHTDDTATVTLANGHYLVMYSLKITGDASPTRRMGIRSRATLEANQVPQSHSYSYHRGDNGCDECAPACMFIVEADASNNDLKIQITQEWEGTNSEQIDVEANAGLMIVKIPDTGSFLRVWEDTDNVDASPASYTTVTFDTESGTFGEEDADFSHSAGSVTINTSGDYLFMFGGYDYQTPNGGRSIVETSWHIDGSDQTSTVGCAGRYNRGAQSGEDTFTGGLGFAAILEGLSATEIVTLRTRKSPYGQDRTVNWQADQYGICAVRLDDLFAAEEPPAISSHTYFETAIGLDTGWYWNSGAFNVDSGMRATSASPTTWRWATISSSSNFYYPSGTDTAWIWVSGSYQGGGQP